jgi:dolichyl-phosphate-mannose-protein mannosyltransferase
MKFIKRHLNGFIALGLGLCVLLVLLVSSSRTGLTRDEGYYFDAAERYAGWFKELGRNTGAAFSEPIIRRYYEINREHPVLVKNLMALSYLALAPKKTYSAGKWPPEQTGAYVTAMRLPAFAFSALGVALLFLFGCSLASRRLGFFAALAFILAPRHFYHAQLACFDMPVAVLWLATVMAYRKSRTSFIWGIATGLIWGLAISVKHNAFFLPPLLVLHWLVTEGKTLSISRKGLKMPRIPLAFFSMLILGPLVFFLHWPFIWHQTFERIGWYFGFHLNHINYYWEYFGTLLTDAPFPWLYPFAVTALTLPLPTLLLGAWGFYRQAGKCLGQPLKTSYRFFARLSGTQTAAPEEDRDPDLLNPSDRWLIVLNAFIPLMIISIPSIPIFGGMKHWLHAMPFICLLGGLALTQIISWLPERLGRLRLTPQRVYLAVSSLVLLPSLLGLIHIGSYGTSYYNELAGGVSGAADLGMQRQYWSNNVTGVLPWINENAPRGARLHLHEVNGECYRTYKNDGYLRGDLRLAWLPDHSDLTAYQYHREFVDSEYRIWNKLGHKKVAHGLYIDEVPIILVYDLREIKPRPPKPPVTREKTIVPAVTK